MRIRVDPVKACSTRRHENTLGIPHLREADPMRIRADPVGSVEAGGTKRHSCELRCLENGQQHLLRQSFL